MATNAQYTAQPVIETAVIIGGTANTARDGSGGGFSNLVSGPVGASAGNGVGKRIIRASFTQTAAAGVTGGTGDVVRLYMSVDGGTTRRLFAEKAVTAVTSSGTAIGFRSEIPEVAGMVLSGSTGPAANAATISATSHAGVTYHVLIESGLL